jgi:hypothetical protein
LLPGAKLGIDAVLECSLIATNDARLVTLPILLADGAVLQTRDQLLAGLPERLLGRRLECAAADLAGGV